ncbi:hypothetical protein [Salinispora cortesiana]|uniref:hypothetical protein n=1 Tax=Salinispora cortesiana TaxID=1305843 RepID=UPI000413AFF6|nr:hypothetical protein [Salinispora cortesiana]
MSAEAVSAGVDVPAGSRADKVEDTIKVVILMAIMAAALAAAFTHMKDWTMEWMPEGTPEWFGWANAVISELLPLVATLSLRKRLRQGKKLWSYALVVLLAGAVLSLAAQLSAVGSDASWSAMFLACLPSLAFLFLSKLVLGDLDGGRKHAEIVAERQRRAAAEAQARAEEVRVARAETAAARAAQAEAETTARAEAARAEAETAARAEAETALAEAETRAAAEAEARAEIEASTEAEIATCAEAETQARADADAEAAQQRAVEAVQAQRLAEGRLAEARDAADRAAAARMLAEQTCAEQVRVLTEVSEQAERDSQQALAEARYTAPTALLTVVTRPPISRSQPWPGPQDGFDPRHGCVRLGPFADGEGVACWRVYTADSMWGGYIQGAQGSGKSRFIDQIAMSCAASTSHPTIVWYGDGQRGDSSPLLVAHADYAATTFEGIYNMVQAAIRVMKINGVENRLNRQNGFTPTDARPGLLVILDECHKPLSAAENPLLATATQQALASIAREGRKVGVGLLMASQSVTLDAFGGTGNSNLADTLRSCLLAGNGLILRSKTPNAKTVFGVDISPKTFPKLPGYGYLCDPDPGARSAPFRGYHVTDELAEYWPGRITWRSLPDRQANMAGTHYARRHQVASEQRFADEMLLAMADAGTVEDIEALERSMDTAAASNTTVDVIDLGGAHHPPVRRIEKFWQQPAARPVLSTGQAKVLDAIRAGHTGPKDIVAATGYSASQVYNLLEQLTDQQQISKARYGHYQATAA